MYSAGSEPGVLSPLAVRALEEVGIDISEHFSKGLTDVPAHDMNVVITLCGEEVCPVFSKEVQRLHWPIPDPVGMAGDLDQRLQAFRDIRDEIQRRLKEYFAV